MLKFFRNIRRSLMAEGKTVHYLKYAVGEIVLVVIGILIALQINTWNEGRKLQRERERLIGAMYADFTSSQESLEVTISNVQRHLEGMNGFYAIITENAPPVSLDSLKTLMTNFFQGSPFKPQLSSYLEAQASGKLELLQNGELLKEITLFMQALEGHEQLREISWNFYFMGPTWEFRKEQGSLAGFTKGSNGPVIRPHRVLSAQEIIAISREPRNSALLENAFILNRNIYNSLTTMSEASQRIIAILGEMKSPGYD